jgi:hypothetical protein
MGEDGKVTREGWLIIGVGLAAALGASVYPAANFFLNFIRTFIHEFGHTVACWFFAHPSAPSFNIATGGGMTVYDDRNNWLLAGIFAVFLLMLFLYRKNRLTVSLLLAGAITYIMLLATDVHEIVILLSGHGAELLVAGILMYRVLGDRRIVGKLQRPAYALTGCFILLQGATFSYQLFTSHVYRHSYEVTKGAGFEMDFTRIAHDFLGVEVRYIALAFFILTLLVPMVSFCCFRFERLLESVRIRIGDRSARGPDDAGSP